MPSSTQTFQFGIVDRLIGSRMKVLVLAACIALAAVSIDVSDVFIGHGETVAYGWVLVVLLQSYWHSISNEALSKTRRGG